MNQPPTRPLVANVLINFQRRRRVDAEERVAYSIERRTRGLHPERG